MPSNTAKLQLRKPDTTDLVNVLADLDGNWDIVDKVSRGELSCKEITANQGGIVGADVDVTGLVSDALVIAAIQRIRIEFLFSVSSTVANDVALVKIQEGATILQSVYVRIPVIALGIPVGGFVRISPTAGTHTYKLVIQRFSGTGTVTINVGAGFPGQLLITDLGQP